MPEYLAPAVYIEEVDTGSKPIEGVSTSTAGMIGVTERGPVDIPILVTSAGEFQRWFGQYLDDTFQDHRYLPHAIDGFFTNGGKRVYVTRILNTGAASYAESDFFLQDAVTGNEVPAAEQAVLETYLKDITSDSYIPTLLSKEYSVPGSTIGTGTVGPRSANPASRIGWQPHPARCRQRSSVPKCWNR